jgi:hypothetical protein
MRLCKIRDLLDMVFDDEAMSLDVLEFGRLKEALMSGNLAKTLG